MYEINSPFLMHVVSLPLIMTSPMEEQGSISQESPPDEKRIIIWTLIEVSSKNGIAKFIKPGVWGLLEPTKVSL